MRACRLLPQLHSPWGHWTATRCLHNRQEGQETEEWGRKQQSVRRTRREVVRACGVDPGSRDQRPRAPRHTPPVCLGLRCLHAKRIHCLEQFQTLQVVGNSQQCRWFSSTLTERNVCRLSSPLTIFFCNLFQHYNLLLGGWFFELSSEFKIQNLLTSYYCQCISETKSLTYSFYICMNYMIILFLNDHLRELSPYHVPSTACAAVKHSLRRSLAPLQLTKRHPTWGNWEPRVLPGQPREQKLEGEMTVTKAECVSTETFRSAFNLLFWASS